MYYIQNFLIICSTIEWVSPVNKWIRHQECSVGTTWSIVAQCQHIHTDKLNSSDWFGHRLCMAYMQFLLTAILLSKAHPAGWILLLLCKMDISLYSWVLTNRLHNNCISLIEIRMTCLWQTCNCTVVENLSLGTVRATLRHWGNHSTSRGESKEWI